MVVKDGTIYFEAKSVLYYKPGTPKTDFLNLDVRGLRRKDPPSVNEFEYVQLYFGDYSIDYGGLDFNKEGVYYMKYTLHFSRINKAMKDEVYNAFYVYVSERFAHLTVEFEGKGSIAEKNNQFTEIKINDPTDHTAYLLHRLHISSSTYEKLKEILRSHDQVITSAQLAADMGITERSANRLILRLEQENCVTTIGKISGGRGRPARIMKITL
mgnify:FL=1